MRSHIFVGGRRVFKGSHEGASIIQMETCGERNSHNAQGSQRRRQSCNLESSKLSVTQRLLDPYVGHRRQDKTRADGCHLEPER